MLFSRIIEKLENKEIAGINYKPRNPASCKANIKRVLEHLRTKKDMNLKYLYDEDILYSAEKQYIIEFLNHVRYAYRLTYKYFIVANK